MCQFDIANKFYTFSEKAKLNKTILDNVITFKNKFFSGAVKPDCVLIELVAG